LVARRGKTISGRARVADAVHPRLSIAPEHMDRAPWSRRRSRLPAASRRASRPAWVSASISALRRRILRASTSFAPQPTSSRPISIMRRWGLRRPANASIAYRYASAMKTRRRVPSCDGEPLFKRTRRGGEAEGSMAGSFQEENLTYATAFSSLQGALRYSSTLIIRSTSPLFPSHHA